MISKTRIEAVNVDSEVFVNNKAEALSACCQVMNSKVSINYSREKSCVSLYVVSITRITRIDSQKIFSHTWD